MTSGGLEVVDGQLPPIARPDFESALQGLAPFPFVLGHVGTGSDIEAVLLGNSLEAVGIVEGGAVEL